MICVNNHNFYILIVTRLFNINWSYFALFLLLLLFSQGLILFASSFFNLGGTLSTLCLQKFKFKYQSNLLVHGKLRSSYQLYKIWGQVGVIVESL